MKVLIVNTSEKTGGAAVAAGRLADALNSNGVEAAMLVRDKESDSPHVTAVRAVFRRLPFLRERLTVFLGGRPARERLFEIDIANSGFDITRTRAFKDADVIHLSWINQGMLSLKGIRKILASGKAVVWTMHDLWPATAVCHYARGCDLFTTRCSCCPLLSARGDDDLSAQVWAAKKRTYVNRNIQFVACSRWLAGEARQSALLAGQEVTSIPNPIDTTLFCPADKGTARRALGISTTKRLLLFVSQRVTDERKGVTHFIEALKIMASKYPRVSENAAVAVIGKNGEDIAAELPLPVYTMGYVGDERMMASVYNAADVYVLPSMEDNLPNTIMEAMACGVPCVGFKVGGIPEMIDHLVNGYVAAAGDAAALAEGIRHVLTCDGYAELSANAVKKVANSYSQHSVAVKYIEVYNKAIAFKRYKIT